MIAYFRNEVLESRCICLLEEGEWITATIIGSVHPIEAFIDKVVTGHVRQPIGLFDGQQRQRIDQRADLAEELDTVSGIFRCHHIVRCQVTIEQSNC